MGNVAGSTGGCSAEPGFWGGCACGVGVIVCSSDEAVDAGAAIGVGAVSVSARRINGEVGVAAAVVLPLDWIVRGWCDMCVCVCVWIASFWILARVGIPNI